MVKTRQALSSVCPTSEVNEETQSKEVGHHGVKHPDVAVAVLPARGGPMVMALKTWRVMVGLSMA